MSIDIRASGNDLWCPRHSSLFPSGVKFWQPSEHVTLARLLLHIFATVDEWITKMRRRRKAFWCTLQQEAISGKRKKKKWIKKEPKSPSWKQACNSKRGRRTYPLPALTLNMLTIALHKNNAIRRQLYLIPLCIMYIAYFSDTQQVARHKRYLWATECVLQNKNLSDFGSEIWTLEIKVSTVIKPCYLL